MSLSVKNVQKQEQDKGFKIMIQIITTYNINTKTKYKL